MPITFNCSQCGKSYTLDDSLAGKQAKCSCGTEMTIPAPAAPAAPAAPQSPFAAPAAPQSPFAAPAAPAAPQSPFAAPVPAQMPPAQPGAMPQMPPAPQPYMQQVQQGSIQQVVVNQGHGGKSDKQKLIAALLCWFVGTLGVHRFYLGHIGIGIAQLLTLGGCGIWMIIDFILILTGGVKDAQGRPLS